MQELFHLEPIYKSFVWAGRKLIDEFELDQSLDKIGTIYCAIAIPGDLDSIVRETNEPLSQFYANHPELFGCNEPEFPVRMTITCNEGFQSYQSHPDDAYALGHDGCRGKVSGAVALRESDHTGTWLFGHKANCREQFRAYIDSKDWDNLFNVLEVKDGDYVHTPAGVIHGGWGSGVITATFGTNGDLTYRFYDNDRNDPNRPLEIDKVCDCASFPELPFCAERIEPVQMKDILRYDYHDVDGEYVAKKFKVNGSGSYCYDSFLIMTCSEGSGTIAGESIAKGETLLIPCNYGTFELKGSMELIAISYNEEGGDKA